MTTPYKLACSRCGSTEIESQAVCYWNEVTQSFSDFRVEDGGSDVCTDCGGYRAEFLPVTDVKTLAQIAIMKQEATQ